jgi:hypothetical protein
VAAAADAQGMNRTHRTKLVLATLFVVALVAAPLALAARGDRNGTGVQLTWTAGKRAASDSITVPAGAHAVLRGTVRGHTEGLRLTIVRRTDGARLFDGSLAGFRSLDLGRLPAALGDETLDVTVTGNAHAPATVGVGWVSGS